jgi:hypothetical protein
VEAELSQKMGGLSRVKRKFQSSVFYGRGFFTLEFPENKKAAFCAAHENEFNTGAF